MDHLQQLRRQLRLRILATILLENGLLIMIWWGTQTFTDLPLLIVMIISVTVSVVLALAISYFASRLV
ncbi:MAG TPA: hypothetical protein VM535_00635, partial [Candidatus Saccharimonadales bacterium]|nr:hypothetical protein [Candidatus Saccharimonadales bacterium]